MVSTTVYNSQFPGPLRFTEGKPVVVDVHNDTDTPEQLHRHGQTLPVDATRRGRHPVHRRRMGCGDCRSLPDPPGSASHTHLVPGADLSLGQYNGQVGPVYIEPKQIPALTTKKYS